jgi:hypothetical protein
MVRFKMVARDDNSIPTQYRTWVVPNAPDFTGAQYTGLKSGPAPFVGVKAYAIEDNTVIANFNLPQPSMWNPGPPEIIKSFPIQKLLPFPLEDSALAIISDGYSSVDGYGHPDGYSDGYVYMFGGKLTSKIYRAPLNNPASWSDTGATLPAPLYGASLAIVGSNIYLFGGNNANGPTKSIFSAPLSNPLSWTNNGNLLPMNLGYSSLGMANGSLYLFGGLTNTGASNAILTASTSNPLSWTNTGSTLPIAIYGSSIAQVDGYWWMYGGMTSPSTPTDYIQQSMVSSPTTWALNGYLPYETAFGQFLTVGTDGYLIGPMVGSMGNGFTSIIQCPLSRPNAFFDTNQVVYGVVSHSQLAIIYDRVWLFGGSGEIGMFACNQELKYNWYDPVVQNYGQITRVVLSSTNNVVNPFFALCFPYWLTDYLL